MALLQQPQLLLLLVLLLVLHLLVSACTMQ
jgi:hypothetical protein